MSTFPRPPAPESTTVFRFSLLLFVLASVYLAWPWLSGEVTIPWDSKAHFQPQLAFLSHALHSGQAPFWTPNVFAGMPQIADPQSLIFSPPYLLLAALDPAPSFQEADAVAYAMLTLGGFGWMLYFRDRGWRAAGGLVAALAFAYGGSAAWRIQHTGQILSLSWFPLTFWALNRALDRASFAWGMLAGLFAAFMVLGRDQIAWLFVLTLTIFVAWRLLSPSEIDENGFARRLLRMIKPLGGGLVVGLVVAGPPLLWTIALAQQSNRSEITLDGALRGSLHPASLLTALAANLYDVHGPQSGYWGPPSPGWGETGLYIARNMAEIYFGALPLIALLVLGVAQGKILDRPMRFFTAVSVAMVIYAFGKYTPVFSALFDVPGANLFRRPADATFTFCAFGAVIGGYCVSRAFDGRSPKRPWAGLALVGALYLVCLGVAVAKGHLRGALPSVGFSAVFAGLSLLLLHAAPKWAGKPTLGLLLGGLLLTVDLSLNNAPNQSTGLPPQLYDVLRENTKNETINFIKARLAENREPDRRDRAELAGIDFHWPNAGLVHGFDVDLGYNPIRLTLFVDVTHANDHVAIPEQRVFSPAFPSYKSPMANLMGLRWIATGVPAEEIDRTLKPGDLPLLKQTSDAYIYENKDALPRVLAPARAVAADFAKIIRDGGMPDIDYRSSVLFDRDTCEAQPELHCAAAAGGKVEAGKEDTGRAKILRYDNTLIDIEAQAPAQGGFLVLNDVWQDWQSASVDGQPAPILRANLMFRAVALSPGPHRVRFRFEPLKGLMQFAPQFLSIGPGR